MAKGKKKKPRDEDDLVDDMSSRIRRALEETPGAGVDDIGEERYTTLALSAIDVVKVGLEERLREIEAEALDEGDEEE